MFQTVHYCQREEHCPFRAVIALELYSLALSTATRLKVEFAVQGDEAAPKICTCMMFVSGVLSYPFVHHRNLEVS